MFAARIPSVEVVVARSGIGAADTALGHHFVVGVGWAGYRLEGERGEGGVHHHPHAVPDATLVHVEVRAPVTKAITPGDARVRSRLGRIVELVAQPAGGRRSPRDRPAQAGNEHIFHRSPSSSRM